MKQPAATLLAGLLGTCSTLHAADHEAGFVPLFNNDNLEGWHVSIRDRGRQENQSLFRIEDGVVHAYPT